MVYGAKVRRLQSVWSTFPPNIQEIEAQLQKRAMKSLGDDDKNDADGADAANDYKETAQ